MKTGMVSLGSAYQFQSLFFEAQDSTRYGEDIVHVHVPPVLGLMSRKMTVPWRKIAKASGL